MAIDGATVDASAGADGGICPSPDLSALCVLPPYHDFGRVAVGETSKPQPFTVTNIHTTISEPVNHVVTAGRERDFPIVSSSCGRPLAPSERCEFSVVFAPTVPDFRNAALEVRGTPMVAFAVGLAGRGVPPVELTPTRLDFGSVPVGAPMAGSPARKFTARNNRTTPIAPLDVRISGEHSQEFSTGDDSCAGTVVAPLASCSFQVYFRPASVGAKTALLEVSGTDVKVTAVLLGAGGPAAP